jgi:hypothetical protein
LLGCGFRSFLSAFLGRRLCGLLFGCHRCGLYRVRGVVTWTLGKKISAVQRKAREAMHLPFLCQ